MIKQYSIAHGDEGARRMWHVLTVVLLLLVTELFLHFSWFSSSQFSTRMVEECVLQRQRFAAIVNLQNS